MGCGASTQSTSVAPGGSEATVEGGAAQANGGSKPTRTVAISSEAVAASAESGKSLDSSSASFQKKRRKTETFRRTGVSAEKMTLPGSSSSENSEEITLTPKSETVTEQLLAALTVHPLFEHLPKELMHRCIEAMVEHSYPLHENVINQGEAGDHFYLVFSGSFEAYAGPNGTEKTKTARNSIKPADGQHEPTGTKNELGLAVLQVFAAGEGFGELALMYNSPRACSVRAISADAVTYALDRTAFRQLVMTHNSGVKHGLQQHLATVPLLHDVNKEALAAIADAMTTIDVEDGEYIVELGDAADCLFLVLSGEVVCHREGGATELLRLNRGDFFGESCLSEADSFRQRLANVVAVGKCRVGCLKAADFQAVCGSLTAVMNREFNRKAIKSVGLLSENLTSGELDELVRELEDITVESGSVVIKQGVTGTNFYIIKSGSVDIMQKAADGTEKKINTLEPGSHFGERSLLTSELTNSSVVASSTTQLMTLDKDSFERVLPPLQDLIARAVAERDEQAARAARPKILYKDLKQITVLGEGTFGRVRLVQWKNNKTKVPFALKTLQKGQLIYYKQVDHVVNEKRVLGSCYHPFILKLEATYTSKNQVYMLLEVALGGELFTHLRGEVKFSQEKATLYAAMVTSAFAYLHARKIAHRDLKPENLLFDETGYLKLVDFGFAKVITDRTWTLCGTPEYLAPEIISNRGHNWGADWWTLGILVYEMLVGQPPFVGATQLDTYHKVTRGKYKMPTNFGRPVKDLISRLLMHNPAARLGCSWGGSAEVLGHEFFGDISFKDLEKKKLPAPFVPTINDPFDTSNFDQYSDDDQAGQWIKYNTPKYEEIWKAEFD